MRDSGRASQGDGLTFSDASCATTFWNQKCSQENLRLELPRVLLQAGFDGFWDHVHRACAEFVFNLNGTGISEREELWRRRVIVPLAMKGSTIFPGVHRNVKQISVVACISAAGEHMTPFFASS
jgi:hypothetical protein